MCMEIALPTRMASLLSNYKIGALCQEAFGKRNRRIVLGYCLVSTVERKLILSR